MEYNSIFALSNIILGVAVLVIWISFLMILVICLTLSKIYENHFFVEVKELLKKERLDINQVTRSVRNCYEVYRRHRFGFSNKKIVVLCQTVSSDIRRGKNLDYFECQERDILANNMDKIIERLQYEEAFNDEKANDLIKELDGVVKADLLNSVKQKLIFLEAYHKGVIDTKEVEIIDLKDKMKKQRWITGVSGAIGIIGSFASIISLFS